MTDTMKSDDLFNQSMKAWKAAADASATIQEECASWVRQMFCESSTLNVWFGKSQQALGGVITNCQQNVDEAIGLMNQQAEASVKLMQKALELRGGESPDDGSKRLSDWWQTVLDTMRVNNQAILSANSRILSTWAEMARKVNGDAAETMSELAEKTSAQAEQMAKSSMARFKELAAQVSGNRT